MHDFWQLNVADVVKGFFLLVGMMGSAWVFTWKMGQMHGENIQKISGLTDAIGEHGIIQREHTQELSHLKSLAESSQTRLRLLEEEMRDNRGRPFIDMSPETGGKPPEHSRRKL